MTDRIPGSSWDNPIWHRRYRIYVGEPNIHPSLAYAFTHDNYEGGYYDAEGSVCEGDSRHGYAATIAACKAEIDMLEDDQ